MKFEWIRCEDKLPETPKSPMNHREYLTVRKIEGYCSYNTMSWADGWNCWIDYKGKIHRKDEIKDIVAWAKIPPYKE